MKYYFLDNEYEAAKKFKIINGLLKASIHYLPAHQNSFNFQINLDQKISTQPDHIKMFIITALITPTGKKDTIN